MNIVMRIYGFIVVKNMSELYDKDNNFLGWYDNLMNYGYKSHNNYPLEDKNKVIWKQWILPAPIKFPILIDKYKNYYLMQLNNDYLIIRFHTIPTSEFIIDGFDRFFSDTDLFLLVDELIVIPPYIDNPYMYFQSLIYNNSK